MKIKIKLLNPHAIMPKRSTQGAAGYDLAYCGTEDITLQPGESITLPTGLAIELPSNDYVALVCCRSGLGIKHNITLCNSIGVVDSDYRGELKIGLINQGKQSYTFQPGERVSQLLIVPVLTPQLEQVAELSDSIRGENGFGSTGKVDKI